MRCSNPDTRRKNIPSTTSLHSQEKKITLDVEIGFDEKGQNDADVINKGFIWKKKTLDDLECNKYK